MSTVPSDDRPPAPVPFPPREDRPSPEILLPLPLTSFIGRAHEVAAVRDLLGREGVRLVVLVGPGGVGKTRLALRVAAEAAAAFRDGVRFVPLAPVREPRFAASAIAQVLDVRETADRPLADALATALRARRLLLVLDNFEHIFDAAPLVSDLLAACPLLTVLATSRAALHVSGEHVYPVPPLALPDVTRHPSLDEVRDAEAVRLFGARAQAVKPGFALTEGNAATVAAICARVDGLPLAIELVAARVSHLSLSTLLARLERRLPLLIGGPRDQPARLQTMRDAIAWSHDLLSASDQALFRRLTVFVGGFTLAAADAVVAESDNPDVDVLPGIASLVSKSFIRQEDGSEGESRYRMLETIREYGRERLAESGEIEVVRARHAAWCLALAERAEGHFLGPDESAWLDRLEADVDNIRAAATWATERGEVEALLRLAGALWRFLRIRNHIAEGRQWLERGLESAEEVRPGVRVRALYAAGLLAYHQNDYDRAASFSQDCLRLARAIGDDWRVADAVAILGVTALDQGGYVRAEELFKEAIASRRAKVDDHPGLAHWLGFLAAAVYAQGDREQAVTLAEASRAGQRAADEGWPVAIALEVLAAVARDRGDLERARDLYLDGLARWQHPVDTWHISNCLVGLADIAVARGRAEAAAHLLGVAERLREEMGADLRPRDRPLHERAVAAARDLLGEGAFRAAWNMGRALPLAQALAEATDGVAGRPEGAGLAPDQARGPRLRLSPREREVLRLMAEGHTDQQIADALFLSRRTVTAHTASIYAKLGVENRVAATAYALRHGLA